MPLIVARIAAAGIGQFPLLLLSSSRGNLSTYRLPTQKPARKLVGFRASRLVSKAQVFMAEYQPTQHQGESETAG